MSIWPGPLFVSLFPANRPTLIDSRLVRRVHVLSTERHLIFDNSRETLRDRFYLEVGFFSSFLFCLLVNRPAVLGWRAVSRRRW